MSRSTPIALLTALALSSAAQAQSAPHRVPRRYLIAGIGAGIGVAFSSITRMGSGGYGACSSGTCATIASTAAGGALGFIIGSERDHLYQLRYRGGRPLELRYVSGELRGDAVAIAASDTLAVAAGTAGAEQFHVGPRDLRRGAVRGATLRGINAVALSPTTGTIAVGTTGGAYMYPGNGTGGALVLESPVDAAVSGGGRTYLAAGSSVVSVPESADSVGAWPAAPAGAPVRGLAWDAERKLVWAGTDSGIVAFAPSGDSLSRVGATRIDAPVRRLSMSGGRLAVALGDSGVRLFDVSQYGGPRPLAAWRGARFAYDVSLTGSRLYVASGLDGVTVLDASGDRLTVIGLAREAGFAVALVSRGGYTYVLDRSHNALRRFDSTAPTQ